jgi:hypothetical protein
MWKFFCKYNNYKDLFWFRIFGYGLSFRKGKLTFSERKGFRKYLKIRDTIITFLRE